MRFRQMVLGAVALTVAAISIRAAETTQVAEKTFAAPSGVKLNVRMEGPYAADVPLQVLCYFKYTPEVAKQMFGAPVELDKDLGGIIASLRERGEFSGEALETLILIPPKDSIKAKALLLIGLGSEADLSTDLMQNVGEAALREATRLGASRVAFAPMIRDQGNSSIDTGVIERAVTTGVLLAYDTEQRLQREGLAKPYELQQWTVEAGPQYYDVTVKGVEGAIDDAKAAIAKRPESKYVTSK